MDDELLAAFEGLTLPFDQWTHRAHVRVAYLYTSRSDSASAIERMRAGVKAYNAANQVPEAIDRGYHETTTVAFMRLIHAAVSIHGLAPSSEAFCDRHPELLMKRVLLKFYTRGRIMSAEAKGTFIEPDLAPLPAGKEKE